MLGGGGMAEHVDSAVRGGGGMAEHEGSAVLGGGGMAEHEGSAVLGGGGTTEQEDSAVGGGGGTTEQEDSAVLGGGGMAEHEDRAVLGGGGIAEQASAVLGGGGISDSILLIVRLRGPVGKRPIRPGVSSAGSDVSLGGRRHRQGKEPTTRGEDMLGWTGEHVRHAAEMVRQGRNPAARVYESIGSEFFLAPAPGWLNLGLWDGAGSEDQAETACRRLVATLASALPAGGVIVDAGNGLGIQDGLIAELVRPRRLVAVNITEWQLAAGRRRLAAAGAVPVVGDAARLPVADGAADGIISVEAAFHFSSRRAFFEQCYRVLRPGGVVTMSDIATRRWPREPVELLSGLTQLRVFGLRRSAAMTAAQIAAAAAAAGLAEIEVTSCGDRVIGPALRLAAARLSSAAAAPAGHRAVACALLWQVELLWRRRVIDYILLRAVRP